MELYELLRTSDPHPQQRYVYQWSRSSPPLQSHRYLKTFKNGFSVAKGTFVNVMCDALYRIATLD
jgi:hypothetical protein